MSSYALQLAFSGFHFSAVEGKLLLNLQTMKEKYRTFFSTAKGWGLLTISENEIAIEMKEGELEIKGLFVRFPDGREVVRTPEVLATPGKACTVELR